MCIKMIFIIKLMNTIESTLSILSVLCCIVIIVTSLPKNDRITVFAIPIDVMRPSFFIEGRFHMSIDIIH